jgi:hypothetical protein
LGLAVQAHLPVLEVLHQAATILLLLELLLLVVVAAERLK